MRVGKRRVPTCRSPYPVDVAKWDVDYSWEGVVGLKVALFPKKGEDVPAAVFDMQLRAFGKGDRRPEILLNLAAVQVGRQDADDARALYDMVLSQPNIDMLTPRGPAWSHDIARRGLAQLQH